MYRYQLRMSLKNVSETIPPENSTLLCVENKNSRRQGLLELDATHIDISDNKVYHPILLMRIPRSIPDLAIYERFSEDYTVMSKELLDLPRAIVRRQTNVIFIIWTEADLHVGLCEHSFTFLRTPSKDHSYSSYALLRRGLVFRACVWHIRAQINQYIIYLFYYFHCGTQYDS